MRCAAPPLIGASRCLLLLLSPLSVRRAHRDLAGSSPLAALHRGHGRDGCPCREPVITVAGYDPAWPGQCEVLRGEDAAAMAGAGVAVVAIGHAGSTSVHGRAAGPVIDGGIVVSRGRRRGGGRRRTVAGFPPAGGPGIAPRRAFRGPAGRPGASACVIADGCLLPVHSPEGRCQGPIRVYVNQAL